MVADESRPGSALLVLGHGQTQFFCFKLARFCATVLADLRHARAIFDSLPSPNIFLYTAMITAYSQSDPVSAAHLFTQMLRRGRPRPNQFIYPPALRSFSASSSLSSIASVHAQISKTGFHGDGVVQTSLLDAYARCSDIANARHLFEELPHRNVVSWTAMITGYAQLGMIGDATSLFEQMPERDVPSWNSIIAAYTQNGLFSDALALFRRMVAAAAPPKSLLCLHFSRWASQDENSCDHAASVLDQIAVQTSEPSTMFGISRLPSRHILRKIHSLNGTSRPMTISVRKRQEDDDSMRERPVVEENPEPVVAFSRPPSIPPLVGPLVLLTLLEMGSDDE